MASGIAPFDRKVHDVGLGENVSPNGPDSGEVLGFKLAGAYSKGFKRQYQSDFQGTKYGPGESLVNVPGINSWTMDDFSGGCFQYVWGKDPAMFASSKNFLPAQFGRSVRSVPPLVEWLGGKRRSSSEIPLLVTPFNGYIYAVFKDRVCRWNLNTGAFSEDALTFGAADGTEQCWLNREFGCIFHSRQDVISVYNLATFGGFVDTFAPPSGVPDTAIVKGGNADGGRCTVSWDNVLWAVDLPDDPSVSPVDGDWSRIGHLPGTWVDARYYSGLLYILLAGSDMQTSLVVFDGTSILPVTDFPYNFVGESLCVYGGRIYVGGSGRDVNTGATRYGELYEITGASLRLIRTFAPERYGAGGAFSKSIPTMAVHEGLLHIGVEGQGLVTYDLTTDSFCGASAYQPADSSAIVRKLVSAREDLFAYVNPVGGVAGTSGWYRPASTGDTLINYYSELETSDFAMSFDRLKAWKQLRVLLRFPRASALLMQYSTDGGATWSAQLQGTADGAGNYSLVTFDLDDVPDSRMIRFKIQVPNQTDIAAFRELIGFTATFRMLDSDVLATGEREKKAWVVSVGGMFDIEDALGLTLHQDLSAVRQQLWTWAEERTKLFFYDIDGGSYKVEIDLLEESQPVILPPPSEDAQADPDWPGREAYFKLTLVEV